MKKVLEDELMSLAHRILKLRNRADIHELKEEAAVLYEKLSVLSFTEKYFDGVKPTIKKHDIEQSIQSEFYLEHNSNLNYPDGTEYNEEPIYEHNTEKIKDIVSQMPYETQQVDKLIDETLHPSTESDNSTPEAIEQQDEPPTLDLDLESEDSTREEVDLEDFGVHFDDLPSFEPAEDEDITEEDTEDISEIEDDEKSEEKPDEFKQQRTMNLFSQQKKSLNDKLNDGLKIGLNDRLSFVNHLFNGDTKTYENFIDNINALQSLDDVKAFLNEQIQDKYSHWKDKEDTANRLLYLIEKKFE